MGAAWIPARGSLTDRESYISVFRSGCFFTVLNPGAERGVAIWPQRMYAECQEPRGKLRQTHYSTIVSLFLSLSYNCLFCFVRSLAFIRFY